MANNYDEVIENLAQQIADLEAKGRELEDQKNAIDFKWAQAQEENEVNVRLLEEANQKYKELEGKIQDYDKKVFELNAKLNNAKNAENYHYNVQSFRTQRKLNEHYRKEIKLANAELKKVKLEAQIKVEGSNQEAEERIKEVNRDLADARRELEESKAELIEMVSKLDVYTHVFNDIIFSKFQAQYPVLKGETANTINPVKLTYVIKSAERADRKDRKKARKFGDENYQKDPKSMSAIMEEIVNEYNEFKANFSKYDIDNRQFKEFDDQLRIGLKKNESLQTSTDVINKMLKDNSMWNVKSMAKSKRGVTLISTVGSIILLGVVAVSVLVPTLGKTRDSLGKSEEAYTQAANSAADIIEKNSVGANYDAITGNLLSAEKVNNWFSNEEIAQAYIAMTGFKVDSEAVQTGYSKVSDAKQKADEKYSYLEDGTLDPNCAYAKALNAYNLAVKNKDSKALEEAGNAIVALNNEMQGNYQNSFDGLQEILDETGSKISDIQVVIDIINAPTASVEFSASTINQYKNALANAEKGGVAKDILMNEYDKETGNVTLLVECVGRNRQTYYNLIRYEIKSGMNVLNETTMLAPLGNGEIVSMTHFDKEIVSQIGGENTQMSTMKGEQVSGDAAINYSSSANYNVNSDSTTIIANALVTVKDDNGNVVGMNVVSVKKVFQGKVSANEKDSVMQNALQQKIADLFTSNEAEMDM